MFILSDFPELSTLSPNDYAQLDGPSDRRLREIPGAINAGDFADYFARGGVATDAEGLQAVEARSANERLDLPACRYRVCRIGSV